MRIRRNKPTIRRTAFLLLFSMLLSIFTVFPSFAEGSGGEGTPQLPDTALSDEVVTEPSVNIEPETMQTETTTTSAVTSTPVKVETANTTITASGGVDMSKGNTRGVYIYTSLPIDDPVEDIEVTIDKPAIVSRTTEPENIATGYYGFTILANEVGIATVSVKVTSTTDATETVSIEIYVVKEDGVYAIKSMANHLPATLGNYYLRVETPSSSVSSIIASTDTYGDVPGNIYRYWKIEYAGNGQYYIRCLTRQEYSLSIPSGSIAISSGVSNAHRWAIRYNSGAYEIASCLYKIGTSQYYNGITLNATSAQMGYYDSASLYYYVDPTIKELHSQQFELWDFEPVNISGIYFRNNSNGKVDTSFSASVTDMNEATIDLDDLGYELLVLGVSSTEIPYWAMNPSGIVSINSSSGLMTVVGGGTTTVHIGIGGYYASFSLTVKNEPVTNGTYFLSNIQTGLYATIQNGTVSNGTEIGQRTFSGANIQKWKFVYHSEGNVYTIQSAQNNSCYLGIANNTATSGASIVLRTGTVQSGMKWRITQGGNGYIISAYSNSSLVLATSTSNATSGAKLVLATWTNDTNYQDEWVIFDQVFYYVNYYDATFTGSNSYLIDYIEDANWFSSLAFSRCLNIGYATDGSAVLRTDIINDQGCSTGANTPCSNTCGSNCKEQHHKNCRVISDTIYNGPREDNHIYVMWTDRPENTYCSEGENNVHETENWIAVVYGKRPVIHFLRISGDTHLQEQACMAITLMHETSHTLGMDDVYDNVGHDINDGYRCVMERFEKEYANEYYENVLLGVEEPFCTSCFLKMKELVPNTFYQGN